MISYVELFVIEDLNNRISFFSVFVIFPYFIRAMPMIVVHEYSHQWSLKLAQRRKRTRVGSQ